MHTPKKLDGLVTYLQTHLTLGEFPVPNDPCGKLHEVKFDDHDLANYEAFPKLIPTLYYNTIYVDDGVIVVPRH